MKPQHQDQQHDHNHTNVHHNNHNHNHHPGEKTTDKLAYLDSQQRRLLMAPEALLEQMPLEKHGTSLDAGAGSGFFTIPMAQHTLGRVYAVEPDETMVRIIETKAEEHGLGNIELLQATLEDADIQNNTIDFALASLLLHEVDSLRVALDKLSSVLIPGGHLFCLEYERDDSATDGPPPSIRIGSKELEAALIIRGFTIVRTTNFTDSIYGILAQKNEA